MCLKIERQVDRVNGKELSYTEFVENYFVPNRPVILTGLMDDWTACKDWVSENNTPNIQFLSTNFGKSEVQVADCGVREFTDQKRLEMTVSEFIEKWVELGASRDNGSSEESDWKASLYLKDWHFVKEYPEYCAYRTPLFFRDDWLNMYLDKYHMHTDTDTYQAKNDITCSDYRFVYMGTKGTWTPLHADVFRSYSWSANVCGKKRWLLLPPSQHHLVFDRYMKNCVYNIFDDVSEKQFPGFKEAIWWECCQEQNEIIFVPSGWYHQVHNLEDTVSINHNWFNAHSLSWVWDLLFRDYEEARDLIEDIRDISDDFEALCQRNLAANTGMNFHDFLSFMWRFTLANLLHLQHLTRTDDTPHWRSSHIVHHAVFNLRSIQCIALKMKSAGVCTNLGISEFEKILDDKCFIELFTTINETYGTIHGLSDSTCKDKMVLFSDMNAMLREFSCSCDGGSEDLDMLVAFAFRKLGLDADQDIPLEK